MDAAFVFLMFVLKLPIAALLWIVWWAIRSPPLPDGAADGDGGAKSPLGPRPRHPRPALPRRPCGPRRGPHGAPAPPPPPRSRPVTARARRVAGHR